MMTSATVICFLIVTEITVFYMWMNSHYSEEIIFKEEIDELENGKCEDDNIRKIKLLREQIKTSNISGQNKLYFTMRLENISISKLS